MNNDQELDEIINEAVKSKLKRDVLAWAHKRADNYPAIKGLKCPACSGSSLFLAKGNYVTCRRIDCPNPDYADAVEAQAADGERKARMDERKKVVEEVRNKARHYSMHRAKGGVPKGTIARRQFNGSLDKIARASTLYTLKNKGDSDE